MFPAVKTFALLLASAMLVTGCGVGASKPETISEVIKDVGKWNIPADQKAKYADLSTNDARTRYTRDTYLDRIGVSETDAERHRLAAAIYLNFSMMQGQAIPNYCQGMNVDVSEFKSAFYRNNTRMETAVGKILTAEGTSFDEIYAEFVPKYKTAAKYELMSTGSSYTACQSIKEKSAQLANMTGFSKFFPGIAQTLRNLD